MERAKTAPAGTGSIPAPQADGAGDARAPAGAPLWWWLGLVLLCLVPRAIVAWKTQVPCSDAVYYLSLAQRLDQPPAAPKDAYYLINPFVLLLALWDKLGWDPLAAGKAFNVLVASLAVLPLVGWVRRQFDERIAWLVALGYAVHPKLVQWSGELVRDPLFWFLVATVMYLGWQVCRQLRTPGWMLPLLALVLALAWQIRVEGLGLYGVLLLWLLLAPVHSSPRRWRVLLQGVLWSAGAGVVVWCGLWLAGGNPQWQWGTLMRFRTLVLGSQKPAAASRPARSFPEKKEAKQPPLPNIQATGVPGPATGDRQEGRAKAASKPVPAMSRSLGNKLFLEAVSQGFGYFYGILLLLSMVANWRHWLRPPTVAVALWSLVVLVFMWIHVHREGGTSTRYVVAPAMLALPTAALGWQWLVGAVESLLARLSRAGTRLRPVLLGGAAVAFVAGHLVVALTREDQGRQRCAELGRWIAQKRPQAPVAGMANWSLIQYYTGGPFYPINALPGGVCHTNIPLLVQRTHPEFVLLCRRRLRYLGAEELLKTLRQLGYRPVDSLPKQCQEFAILLRRTEPAAEVQQAQRPNRPPFGSRAPRR